MRGKDDILISNAERRMIEEKREGREDGERDGG